VCFSTAFPGKFLPAKNEQSSDAAADGVLFVRSSKFEVRSSKFVVQGSTFSVNSSPQTPPFNEAKPNRIITENRFTPIPFSDVTRRAAAVAKADRLLPDINPQLSRHKPFSPTLPALVNRPFNSMKNVRD
jgi:hypothetical protein